MPFPVGHPNAFHLVTLLNKSTLVLALPLGKRLHFSVAGINSLTLKVVLWSYNRHHQLTKYHGIENIRCVWAEKEIHDLFSSKKYEISQIDMDLLIYEYAFVYGCVLVHTDIYLRICKHMNKDTGTGCIIYMELK